MSPLNPLDQFYLQRSLDGSNYTKHRISVEELETHILGGYQDGVTDISDRLDQEIVDRKDGDSEIYEQIDALTDRISILSTELYDNIVASEYEYVIDNDAKANYDVLTSQGCAGLTSDALVSCQREKADAYIDQIASSSISDSRGRIYLVNRNYTYQNTICIFLSDRDKAGNSVELSRVTKGSLLEMIAITQDANGNDIIDNFNYGFWKIIEVGVSVVENNGESTDPSYLYKFDVEHVGSAPENGKPSVQLGENRFMIKLVADLQTTLNEVYVNKSGDDMSGALNIETTDTADLAGSALTTGLDSKNRIIAPEMKITGYNPAYNINPAALEPSLHFTTLLETTIAFDTPETTIVDIKGNFELRDPSGFVITNTQEILDADTGSVVSPPVTKIKNLTLFQNVAEYQYPPNIFDPTYTSSPSILTHKGYVDYIQEILDNKITDVSQRIDTLANASDVFAYHMLLDGDSAECDELLALGGDPVNGGYYPGYDPLEPGTYDPTTWDAGIKWAQCISETINTINDDRGLFGYGTFNEPYTDSDGNETTREVDIFVLDSEATLLLDDTAFSNLDFFELGKVGNYFEISAADGRSSTYGVYIITDVKEHDGNGILTCKNLFRSQDDILTGLNYKVKFYNKEDGLTLEQTEALYVRKTGDEMSNHLRVVIDDNTSSDVLQIRNNFGRKLFVADNKGVISGTQLTLREGRQDPNEDYDFNFDRSVGIQVRPFIGTAVNFINHKSGDFNFLYDNKEVFKIGSEVNFLNKRAIGLGVPVRGDGAATLDWLSGKGGANGLNPFLVSTDNTISVERYEEPEQYRLKVNIGNINTTHLTDVEQDNRIHNSALLWDGENQKWVASDEPIRAFIPGQKVAYMGESNTVQGNVEVGGLWLSPSNNQLYLRIS